MLRAHLLIQTEDFRIVSLIACVIVGAVGVDGAARASPHVTRTSEAEGQLLLPFVEVPLICYGTDISSKGFITYLIVSNMVANSPCRRWSGKTCCLDLKVLCMMLMKLHSIQMYGLHENLN